MAIPISVKERTRISAFIETSAGEVLNGSDSAAFNLGIRVDIKQWIKY
jgi:hypothetical protein